MFEQWVPPCHEQPGPPWAVAVESESAVADAATDDDYLAAAAIGHDEGRRPARKGGSEPPGGGNDGAAPLPRPDGVADDRRRPRR